nr:PilX N-terminal domain-containing pilus assembly protein [Arenimonas daejeonensis]
MVIVLLLLLVITLLGLASMRGAVLQERMSGNAWFRSEAFQGAEAVLREAESNLAVGGRPTGVPASGCSSGLCAMPVNGEASAWEVDDFWTSGSGFATSNLETSEIMQRYVIEDMGDGRGESEGCTSDIDLSAPECTAAGASARNYRITAFSRLSNGAEVMLQSTFQLP